MGQFALFSMFWRRSHLRWILNCFFFEIADILFFFAIVKLQSDNMFAFKFNSGYFAGKLPLGANDEIKMFFFLFLFVVIEWIHWENGYYYFEWGINHVLLYKFVHVGLAFWSQILYNEMGEENYIVRIFDYRRVSSMCVRTTFPKVFLPGYLIKVNRLNRRYHEIKQRINWIKDKFILFSKVYKSSHNLVAC